MRVAWTVKGADGGALDLKHLAIENLALIFSRGVLVDGGREVGVQAEQVGNSARVVSVPVGQENMR
jgi:hypothetical protein